MEKHTDTQEQHTCQSHGQPTVVYCKECEKPLCGDCLADHKKHNYLTLQEIEGEVVPLMLKREQKSEALLRSLQEQHERLVNRIKNIRVQQEERELAIRNYMKNVEAMVHKKHREMISVEEEMIIKLIPLSFRVERQIISAKQEMSECKAKLAELQGLKQPERTWKAFHIMLEKKAYVFEEDQKVQQQQAEAFMQIGGAFEVPLGILFDQVPALDAIGLDSKKAAFKTEKIVLKEAIKKLTEELVGLQDKYKDLLHKLGQIKGIIIRKATKLDLRSTNEALNGKLGIATRKIEELQLALKKWELETGFIRPRLTQARRVFQSSQATFCSCCMNLCSRRDMLKCNHYLCIHCRASDLPCKLCNTKEKHDLVKLSCSCIVPREYLVEHVLGQTHGQILQVQNDADMPMYPLCFCGKQLSEADMQVLFRKEIYERVKALSHELAKTKAQRIHNIIEEQGYRTKRKVVIYCKDADFIDSKEILAALEHNKSITSIIIKGGGEVSERIIHVLGKFPVLALLSFKDAILNAATLQSMVSVLLKAKVQKLVLKNVRLESQRCFEYIGAILWQIKAEEIVLKNTGMNDYGLLYMAEPILKTESLKKLSLAQNNLSWIGLRCAEDILKENNHLVYVGLKQERAGPAYYEYIKGLRGIVKNIEFDAF